MSKNALNDDDDDIKMYRVTTHRVKFAYFIFLLGRCAENNLHMKLAMYLWHVNNIIYIYTSCCTLLSASAPQQKFFRNLIPFNRKVCEYHVVYMYKHETIYYCADL